MRRGRLREPSGPVHSAAPRYVVPAGEGGAIAREKQAPSGVLRVAALSGSMRAENLTRRALEVALRGAASLGAETELLDLSRMEIPFCDERKDESTYPPDVHRLRRAVGASHGVILGSPEYHGSLSGALKNAIDFLGFEELEGKMVGLVAVAGGSQGASGSLAHMRTVCRHLHAWVVPRQVSISRARDVFTPDGHLTDPDHEERLLSVGRDVANYARLHFGV